MTMPYINIIMKKSGLNTHLQLFCDVINTSFKRSAKGVLHSGCNKIIGKHDI